MAVIKATKSGNWSDATVWSPSAPTASDDVYSNTFTVTIDTSPTVLSISNAAATGVTAGGSFVPTNGITLTCTAGGVIAGPNGICFASTLTTGQSCTIIGNCFGGTSGSNSGLHGASNGSSGTLNIVGNCTGGARNSSSGAINSSTGTLNITGNCIGSSSASNSNMFGAANTSSGTLNITGNCTGGTSVALTEGAYNSSTGTLNVTGTITGGSFATAYGATNNSTGTLTHVGTAQASTATAAIGLGPIGQVTILSGPLLSTDASAGGAAASGVNPCVALRWFPADNALSTFEYRLRGQTVSGSPSARPARQLFLPDAYSATYPSAANVRSGTTYGPGSIYSGTCAVPAAASVLFGVPVDATTGTATVSAADIRSAIGLASANLDTQLAAKPSATAIRTELDSNSTKLANLDATVSSRLAASSYSAAPSAATNASAVRTELATELGRIDTTVSSRLASSSYSAAPSAADIATAVWAAGTRTLTTTIASASDIASAVWSAVTRTLTSNAAPSAADVATAVRSELGTELGRIDASVSSRLATSGYSAPLDAAGTRSAVGLSSGNLDTQLSGISSGISGLPSASAIASAVWAAATRTLTTAIDNSSTIAAAVWAYASGRTVTGGTVDTLTNPPSVPSAATVASAVRTELSTELARLDTTVSSRLAPAGTLARVTLTDTATTLTNAPSVPSPQTVASAVRTELSAELAHLDANVSSRQATLARLQNVATTQEVGDIVEEAMQP